MRLHLELYQADLRRPVTRAASIRSRPSGRSEGLSRHTDEDGLTRVSAAATLSLTEHTSDGYRKMFKSLWTRFFPRIRVFSNDIIEPRLSVAVRRHLDRLPHGLSSCLPSPVEVQAHHRDDARDAGAVHRRDDGDFLVGLFADVEAAAVSGAGADCRAVPVRGEGRLEPHAGQRPVLPRLSRNATSYESLALWTFSYSLVGEKDSVVRIPGVRATAEIFNILRIQPVLGTFFTKEQNKPGADKVIVLTQSYWQTQYQESPEVIGKEVRIDEETYKVIGVAPRVLEAFDARMKFVVPLSWPPAAENPQGRYGVGIQLFGRLKPGVMASQADAEAKTLEKRYVDAGPPQLKAFAERSGMTMNVGGVQEQRVQPVRPTLLLLQGGVAFVLLIGCVNVANLLLVRSNSRQSELAVRSALGAPRATIARQLLLESLLLTSLGAALGLGVAWGALRVTNFYLAKMLPQSLPASLDWRVLGFAVALPWWSAYHRPDPGVSPPAHESGRGDPEQFAERVVEPWRARAEQRTRRGPGRGGVDAVDRRRPAHPELRPGLARRYRTRSEERGDRAHRVDAGTSWQRRGRQLDSRTAVPGDARDSGSDVGGAVRFHAVPGRTADQRVHPGKRYAAARCAAAGRLPGHRNAGIPPNAGVEADGRPLL